MTGVVSTVCVHMANVTHMVCLWVVEEVAEIFLGGGREY